MKKATEIQILEYLGGKKSIHQNFLIDVFESKTEGENVTLAKFKKSCTLLYEKLCTKYTSEKPNQFTKNEIDSVDDLINAFNSVLSDTDIYSINYRGLDLYKFQLNNFHLSISSFEFLYEREKTIELPEFYVDPSFLEEEELKKQRRESLTERYDKDLTQLYVDFDKNIQSILCDIELFKKSDWSTLEPGAFAKELGKNHFDIVREVNEIIAQSLKKEIFRQEGNPEKLNEIYNKLVTTFYLNLKPIFEISTKDALNVLLKYNLIGGQFYTAFFNWFFEYSKTKNRSESKIISEFINYDIAKEVNLSLENISDFQTRMSILKGDLSVQLKKDKVKDENPFPDEKSSLIKSFLPNITDEQVKEFLNKFKNSIGKEMAILTYILKNDYNINFVNGSRTKSKFSFAKLLNPNINKSGFSDSFKPNTDEVKNFNPVQDSTYSSIKNWLKKLEFN